MACFHSFRFVLRSQAAAVISPHSITSTRKWKVCWCTWPITTVSLPVQRASPGCFNKRAVSLKEQAQMENIFLKIFFRPYISGCGRYLSSSDGHSCCLTCRGCSHTETAFVDDSCPHCENMTMGKLQSDFRDLSSSLDRKASMEAFPPGPSPQDFHS